MELLHCVPEFVQGGASIQDTGVFCLGLGSVQVERFPRCYGYWLEWREHSGW